MHTKPLTTREAFCVWTRSTCDLCRACGRGMRQYVEVFTRGYIAKNHQYPGRSSKDGRRSR